MHCKLQVKMNSELTQKKDKDSTPKEATCPRMTESRIHHLPKALRGREQGKKKEGSRARETKKWTHLVVVRSPVSSLDPADTCPSVTVMAFPPVTPGAPPWEGVQGPPAGSPWETRDTLILGRLEVFVPGRGLGGWCRFSWTLRSSFSASSVCSDEMGTKRWSWGEVLCGSRKPDRH